MQYLNKLRSASSAWLEQIWWRSPSPPPLLLRLAERIYASISRMHIRYRARHAISASLPVISIGNITAGGSGKTPFTLWLSDALQNSGLKPVILCRGDGGAGKKPVLVNADSDPSVVGDEARLLAEQSACPVIAARDRIAGSRLAGEHGDILILDDGFQYCHLQRCCNIALIPAEGVGNGHMIPAGPLREPVHALSRADIIVRTGKGEGKALGHDREWRWSAVPDMLEDITGVQKERPDTIFAAAGIARPERFFSDLAGMNITLSGKKAYPDHHRFSTEDVKELTAQRRNVAVTAKDAVKLAPIWPQGAPLWVLSQQGQGEEGLLEEIQSVVKCKRKNM
jgi:tetraacyldisaccharide 4'-kinase